MHHDSSIIFIQTQTLEQSQCVVRQSLIFVIELIVPYRWLKLLNDYGVVLVTNVPSTDEAGYEV